MRFCLIDVGIFIEKPELIDPLKQYGEVAVYATVPETVEEVIDRAQDAEVVMFAIMQFSNEMLDKLPKLKVLQFVGTGVSNFVDVEYAKSKGIKVLNIAGYGSNAVAEYAIAATFAVARNIIMGNQVISEGRWDQNGLRGIEIKGSTVGIAGTGSIGRLVAEKFKKLGADVIACDIYENDYLKKDYEVKYVSMKELFERSDIVSLHMLVTKDNTRMIDRKYFEVMKSGAIFINVARAELVNAEDLYETLKSGKLRGAAIDVFNHEPPNEMDIKIASFPNVIATPHIAYFTEEATDNSIIMSVDSVITAINEVC